MAAVCSVLTSVRTWICTSDRRSAEARTISAPRAAASLSMSRPTLSRGQITIITPTRPKATALMRTSRILSPSITAARMTVKIGVA